MPEVPAQTKKSSSPLPGVALVLVAFLGVAVVHFATKPGAKGPSVAKRLEEARAKLAAGDRLASARLLAALASEPPSGEPGYDPVAAAERAREARELLAKMAREALEPGHKLDDAAPLLEIALDATRADEPSIISSETLTFALDRASSEAPRDPKGACDLTEMLARFLEGSPHRERLHEARTKALEAKLAADPGDVLSRIALADVDLSKGDAKAAADRLQPVAGQLGDGEGARVLGLARAALGAREEAVALLSSYVGTRMSDYGRATTGFAAAVQSAEDRIRNDLKAGRVDPAFKKKHEALRQKREAARTEDELARLDEERLALVHAYMDERISFDPDVRDARRAIVATANVVRCSIQLALLEIDLARGKPEAEKRAALETAEKRMSAVEEVGPFVEIAFGLALGRVELQLGKKEETARAFEGFLVRQGRTSPALLAVATAYADARELVLARTLSEEAWKAASRDEDRERAAVLRSHLGETREEQLAWLEKAGSDKSPPIAAMTARVRAEQAGEEGRFEEAQKLWDQAISFYEGDGAALAPVSVVASLRFARFLTSGARPDLDRAIAMEEKAAVVEVPEGSQKLEDELADELLTRALLDAVGTRLRTDILRDPSLDLLEAAAKDRDDLLAIQKAFSESLDRKRSLELRERSLRSDPVRPVAFQGLVADAKALRDSTSLLALSGRLESAPMERTEAARRMREAWVEKDSPRARKGFDARRKQADAILAEARTSAHAATIARALTQRARIEREAWTLGSPCDLALDVSLCEEAVRVFPNRSSRLALVAALFARTAASFAGEGSSLPDESRHALSELLREHGKLGSVKILAILSRKDAGLAKALAAAPDVAKALELARVVLADEGDDLGTHDWLVALAASDASAASIGKRLAASSLPLAVAKAMNGLAPASPECVLELATLLEARGELSERKKLLDRAREAQVPLPYALLER